MSSERPPRIGGKNLIMTVGEYMKNKYVKSKTLYRIKEDGKGYYVMDGAEIPEKEMNQCFPTPPSLLTRNNCDGTKTYLQ